MNDHIIRLFIQAALDERVRSNRIPGRAVVASHISPAEFAARDVDVVVGTSDGNAGGPKGDIRDRSLTVNDSAISSSDTGTSSIVYADCEIL